MDRHELFLKAQSWCFANNILVKYQLASSTSAIKKHEGGKVLKILLRDVRMVVFANGRVLKKGTIVYTQGSRELINAYQNLFIHFYESRAKNSVY